MSADLRAELLLAGVAFAAAAVNGGLGTGFSSITVPAGLLFRASRVLNPALVLLELPLNAAALLVNRGGLASVLPRIKPLLLGAVPGTALGGLALASTATVELKLFTFAALLPLLVAQAAGFRLPTRRGRGLGLPQGVVLGSLYGATTLSGPPLVLLFADQGFDQQEFRAALAAFRIVESACALCAYLALGLLGTESLALSATLAPAVVLGVPLGFFLLRDLAPGNFRRISLAVSALLVAFGLGHSLLSTSLFAPPLAPSLLASTPGRISR